MATPRKRRRSSSTPAFPAPLPSITITALVARLYRLRASHVLAPHRGPTSALTAALLGVQGQESSSAALSLHLRLASRPSLASLAASFSRDTQASGLVRVHAQRGTLHVLDAHTSWPVTAACLSGRILDARRRKMPGVDAAREKLAGGLAEGRDVSAKDLPGAEFGERYFAMMGVTYAGLGARVSLGGRTVIGPREGVVREGLVWEEMGEDEGLVRAGRVYFEAFGPAAEEDFRFYMGVCAPQSRAAVGALVDARELVEVVVKGGGDCFDEGLVGGKVKYIAATAAAEIASLKMTVEDKGELRDIPLLLLGKFDVLVLGHADKRWLVVKEFRDRVWTKGAHVRAVVMVQGRVRGVWSYAVSAKGKGRLTVSVAMFPGSELSNVELKRLESIVKDLANQFFSVEEWKVEMEDVEV